MRTIDPETLAVLDDNGNTDDWTELLPKERPDDQFEPVRVKALKPMWVIELQCFPDGGLQYERSEGDIAGLMFEWSTDVAEIFKAQHKPAPPEPTEPLTDALDCFAIADTPVKETRHPGQIDGSFYAVFHSSWQCYSSYDGDDYEMELEFVGELASVAARDSA